MKLTIITLLSIFSFGNINLSARNLEISDEIASYENAWKAKDVAALKAVLNKWEQEDNLDPALWYLSSELTD